MHATAARPVLVSVDGMIRFTANAVEDDHYLDADFGYSSEAMGLMLAQVDALGYDVMSGDECLPDVFDPFVRAYACRKG